ncbi:hypothetical protein FF38_05186 [Lucilia cuprina]|uniref:Uncharacterized protein n=1 Tax=Lucilia cuprina TaxID=7375 RepID=A0A0L0CGK3_LUCCU|nr:hypothetical protein FF38_05186 [Lucilia cuprina]
MPKTATNNTASSMSTHSPANVLLATAQVKVKSLHGEYIMLRALIDHCSQRFVPMKSEIYCTAWISEFGKNFAEHRTLAEPHFLQNSEPLRERSVGH